MKAHVIENGVVVNTIVVDQLDDPTWLDADVYGGGPGWVLVDGVLKDPNAQLIDPEQQAADVRAERNTLLAACDWTQLADAPVDKEAWATYRQALRDITDQPGFPSEVMWPTQP